MMHLSSMSPLAYWLGSGVFCFLVSLTMTLILYGFAYLFGVSTFVNTSFSLFAAVAVLWAFATTGYSFLLGALFRNSKAATVLAYLLIIFLSITSTILNNFVTNWPTWLYWLVRCDKGSGRVVVLAGRG